MIIKKNAFYVHCCGMNGQSNPKQKSHSTHNTCTELSSRPQEMLGHLQEASQKELAKRLEDKVQRRSGAAAQQTKMKHVVRNIALGCIHVTAKTHCDVGCECFP